MSVSAATRYRLEDLRRFGSELLNTVGVAPTRASTFASHLLWFDAAGASSHGIACLPEWLERIEKKEIDPKAEGRPHHERSGTALFDANQGVGPLAMIRAAGIASEKARDVGLGLVRVGGLGFTGPLAPVAAELAVGPFLAMILGPGPSIAIALPTDSGLPVVFDSALAPQMDPSVPATWFPEFGPWIAALSGQNGYSILTLAVPAVEPLTSFQERISRSLPDFGEGPGTLLPLRWESARREARERGVTLGETESQGLRLWADRLGIAWPTRLGR